LLLRGCLAAEHIEFAGGLLRGRLGEVVHLWRWLLAEIIILGHATEEVVCGRLLLNDHRLLLGKHVICWWLLLLSLGKNIRLWLLLNRWLLLLGLGEDIRLRLHLGWGLRCWHGEHIVGWLLHWWRHRYWFLLHFDRRRHGNWLLLLHRHSHRLLLGHLLHGGRLGHRLLLNDRWRHRQLRCWLIGINT